ncbi:hypothetical protein ENTCAN_07267 [Enterobacter cancerogenus ATCC 35316]|nr:hypothetical protein ENTCAN_07267 [Enterobacter cancerogenus ATCC 35316]
MRFFSLQIIVVLTDLIPPHFEYRSGFSFYRIVIEGFDLTLLIVLFTAFMVGISTGARIAHLNEFSSHIHANKVVLLAVFFKQGIYLFCRTRRHFSIFVAPVRKDFAFIRLDHQNALFTPANLVQFGTFAKINVGKILLIIKWTGQSGTIVKVFLTILDGNEEKVLRFLGYKNAKRPSFRMASLLV